ncbi:MAG: DUF1385 domain-containing protein [Oscillospiraceae bacterium]|nr:DUF1385 domain-containing protein [Oscillospiraceae bacterium]
MAKNKDKKERISVGGEALIEGIMMNGPKGAAIAVRKADGSIHTEKKEFRRLKDKVKILGWPVMRGVVSFAETMIFGYKCMMESAEISGKFEDDTQEGEKSKVDLWLEKHMGEKFTAAIMVAASAIAVVMSIFLFIWFPAFIVDMAEKLLKFTIGNFRPAIEVVIRMAVLVTYMYLVSRIKDIKRTFMYHGAEHKTIFCFESGEELNVENVRKQKRFHPRCGTSFIFVVLVISVFVSTALNLAFPGLRESRLVWTAAKLAIMPVIMGIGYEFIRFAGKHDNIFVKILSAPGLAMQRITTIEPSDDMIEIGIASLKAVVEESGDGEV